MPSTWTTTLPAGTTKIRMAPNILQDRWLNIEQGEVPSDKWELQKQAGDPTSVSGSGLIYTKDGGAGTTELYYEDDAGTPNIVQLTTTGGIGKASQAVYGSTYVSLQSDLITTFTNTQDGFCSAAGRVSGTDGTLQANYKCGVGTRNGTGDYTVTFADALKTAEGYAILITPRTLADQTSRFSFNIYEQTASQFSVQMRNPSGAVDCGFMFVVFMSRI